MLLPTLPGPVVGLVLMLLFLVWRREVHEQLGSVADTFGRYLGLLFVPAAVGVALYLRCSESMRWHSLGAIAIPPLVALVDRWTAH